MTTSRELRQKFLDFFESKGHTVLPSSSLVPKEDPTVLFNTAGMQPIVPFLLGESHPGGTRLVNSQKCIRTVDIEEVGDNRHATFFEMLGFWSLGDYFKEETIEWMFEFLTAKEWLNLDPKRLFVTVYKGNSQKKVENLANLISQKMENDLESNLENGIKLQNENLGKPKTEFINEVDSDEEAVVFWQKQFEKVGIYADVGDEFDFKKAKLETTKLELENLQNPEKTDNSTDNSEQKNPKIWSLNFRNFKTLEQILSGKKTIETRALNPDESDRYFGDIWAFDILELVDKSENENGELKSFFWTIDKVEVFANLKAAFEVLDFQKVLPEISLEIENLETKISEKSQVLTIEKTENWENDSKNDEQKLENNLEIAKKSNSDTNSDTKSISISETENNLESLNSQKNNQKESFSLGQQIDKIINVFKKDEDSDLLKIQNWQKVEKPTLEEISQIYREKLGEEYLEKIEKNGLVALFFGKQVSKMEAEAYLKAHEAEYQIDHEIKNKTGSQNSQNLTNQNLETSANFQKENQSQENQSQNSQNEKNLANSIKSTLKAGFDNNSEIEEKEHQLLILSGPSGSGKSTVTRHLLEERSDFALSVSCTTRSTRMNEENGKEYYFLTREEFETKIKNGEFVEWQEVYLGVFYGTLKSEIERIWTIGKIPIFDIDYAGGLNLKKLYPQAVDIFLEAPSVQILEERLRSRGTETEEKIATRIAKAKIEMEHKNQFSNVVINREWTETVEIISQILLENTKGEKEIEKIPQVLFASTNPVKIADFRQALQHAKIEVLTLQDFDYQIPEPLENGTDNVQNAQIKAEYYWQNLRVKIPVIAQDNAKFLDGVTEDDQPKENIKGIVEAKFGNCEPETMVKFYQELATKYGGCVRAVENIAICLFDGQNISNEVVEIETFLTSDQHGDIDPSYPISVLSQVKINKEFKFWQEVSETEKADYLQELTNKYQKLISDLEGFNKTKVIFIHGGDSFDNYEKYLENLQKTPVKWNQKTNKWKDNLEQSLGDNYNVCQLCMPNSQNANYEEWRIQFDKIRETLDYKTVLVGHSLGGIFLAKYLSENELVQKISQLHLVAAPFESVGNFTLIGSDSLENKLAQIQKNCQQIYLYHSTDDSIINFENLTKYQGKLPEAQSLVFATRGHFLQSEFPELVEQIKKNKRLDKISIPSKIEKTVQNSELELEKPSKYIYRITKKSGKDNWWGLPYRGPCGPCSEVYYLLDKNDLNFEQSIFPTMNLTEIENFIENDIVEIGNNVFMSYIGEKDAQDEPINLIPLAKQNIDTGLGFERFLAVINGMESIHDTDCLKPISDVARRWARVEK